MIDFRCPGNSRNWEFSILWWLSAQISLGGVKMGVGPSRRSQWSSLWVARTSGASSDLSVGVEVSPLLNSSRWPIANWSDRWRTTAVRGAWHQKWRLWESLLRVIQSESQEDSNHSDQARQAQYLDTVDEVFGRISLRATFAGRCCCWWSNYLFRWLKTQRLRMSIIHELIIRKTIAKTKKRTNMLCSDFQE